jgi:hypothetical protein
MIVSQGGLCVYSYEFTEMKINPQLVAGFTTAIGTFSQSLLEREQNIESLQMTALNLKISPFLHNALSMVVFFNKYDNIDTINSIIIDLQTQFIESFGNYEIEDFFNMTLLKPFNDIVIPLCNTHIDIGMLSVQSVYKSKLWELIVNINSRVLNESHVSEGNKNELKTIEYKNPNLPTCDISIWNLDLETAELHQSIFQNKQIFIIIIEADFNFIQKNISIIEILKKYYSNSLLVGIMMKESGTIALKNIEKLLQIPIYELSISDPSAKDNLTDIVYKCIIGF